MAVICFASLKGGVGKTSVALNVSHALAKRGCETLLIDLDPACHASRFLEKDGLETLKGGNPLARLFAQPGLEAAARKHGGICAAAEDAGLELSVPVRPRLSILPAGPELRRFLFDQTSPVFPKLFRRMMAELSADFDYVVLDTPPDFNVLTGTAIIVSDLVVVPADCSAMSIHALEDLITHSADIKGPSWAILRTQVNRAASKIRRLSEEGLRENFTLCSPQGNGRNGAVEIDFEDAGKFISYVAQHEKRSGRVSCLEAAAQGEAPIFLLESIMYRTEEQNRLSFQRQTAFDSPQTVKLAEQYSGLAKELEQVLTLCEEEDPDIMLDQFTAGVGRV